MYIVRCSKVRTLTCIFGIPPLQMCPVYFGQRELPVTSYFLLLMHCLLCLVAYSKDVRLPVQLQRAMAAEAEAAREARAKVYKNTNCSISIVHILVLLVIILHV